MAFGLVSLVRIRPTVEFRLLGEIARFLSLGNQPTGVEVRLTTTYHGFRPIGQPPNIFSVASLTMLSSFEPRHRPLCNCWLFANRRANEIAREPMHAYSRDPRTSSTEACAAQIGFDHVARYVPGACQCTTTPPRLGLVLDELPEE
jgi:hypothetical protein